MEPALRRAGFKTQKPHLSAHAGISASWDGDMEPSQELEMADLEVGAGLGSGFDYSTARLASTDLESGSGAAAAVAGSGAEGPELGDVGIPHGVEGVPCRPQGEDEDVVAEREHVLSGGAASDAIALVHLRKVRVLFSSQLMSAEWSHDREWKSRAIRAPLQGAQLVNVMSLYACNFAHVWRVWL